MKETEILSLPFTESGSIYPKLSEVGGRAVRLWVKLADHGHGSVQVLGLKTELDPDWITVFRIGGSPNLLAIDNARSHPLVEDSVVRLMAQPLLVIPGEAVVEIVIPPEGDRDVPLELSLLCRRVDGWFRAV